MEKHRFPLRRPPPDGGQFVPDKHVFRKDLDLGVRGQALDQFPQKLDP
jgi:hypothetical protein